MDCNTNEREIRTKRDTCSQKSRGKILQKERKASQMPYLPPAATCNFARDATMGTARNAYATHAKVNPLPTDATRSGASEPDCKRATLKSSTDLPNHIRRMRKEVKPVMKPKTPNQATPL